MFQAGVVQRLSVRYGRNIVLANPLETVVNVSSGDITRTFDLKTVKALCLPAQSQKEISAENTQGVRHGASYETESIRIVLRKSLLGIFIITQATILRDQGHTYFVTEILSQVSEYIDILFHRVEDIDLSRTVVRPAPAQLGMDAL